MKRMHLMEFFTLLFFLPSYASNGALRFANAPYCRDPP